MKIKICVLRLVVMLILALQVPVFAQANQKLMSIKAAKTDAQRAILESIVGLKVRSVSEVHDMVASRFDVDTETSGVVKDIEFTDIVYDPEKDVAKVTAQIKLGRVLNVIGRQIDYGDNVVERIGFGTTTAANAGPLKALRAAQIDAYQQLAEQIVGLQIDSTTRVEDYVLKSDDVKSTVLAAIWGAKMLDYGWDSDGTATAKFSIQPNYVRDVMGQVFIKEHPEIVVEGMGTSGEPSKVENAPSTNQVREAPVSTSEDTGGGASLR